MRLAGYYGPVSLDLFSNLLLSDIFLEQQKATRGKDGIASFTRNEVRWQFILMY